jgi:hypothetical protein
VESGSHHLLVRQQKQDREQDDEDPVCTCSDVIRRLARIADIYRRMDRCIGDCGGSDDAACGHE